MQPLAYLLEHKKQAVLVILIPLLVFDHIPVADLLHQLKDGVIVDVPFVVRVSARLSHFGIQVVCWHIQAQVAAHFQGTPPFLEGNDAWLTRWDVF